MSEARPRSNMQKFLAEAYKLFDLGQDGRGERNAQYIDVPVRIAEGHLPDDRTSADATFANPLLFITGIRTRRTTPSAEQPIAPSPSLSLVVGQYGLGKTELIFQVAHQMAHSVETALPVNLGLCRDDVKLLDAEVSADDMARLLFGRIVRLAELDASFALEELQPSIRSGKVVLLLDGLDELISTPAQHHAFFTGLTTFLEHGATSREPRFKVVVTMRLEYLSALPDDGRIARSSAPVYYLALDYLNDSGVDAYLRVRLPSMTGIYREIARQRLLLDMFRRPLLLRIFCDLASRADFRREKVFESLEHNNSPAALLEEFIEIASRDSRLVRDQRRIDRRVIWNPDRLASKSLDLYRNGEAELTIAHLRDVIEPLQGQISEEEMESLPATEVLKGLHKCPFLRQNAVGADVETARVARFAHKIFFEYFTAKAMAAEMRAQSIAKALADDVAAPPSKRAFDELVLNVDMRKFLRGLLDSDKEWQNETRKSYGLVDAKDLEEWKAHGTTDLAELDEMRWTLLRFMTDPEHPPENMRQTVEDFLERQKRWLHPRYLLYNYEAVAVFLWYERRNPAIATLKKKFSDILQARLEDVLRDLRTLGAEGHDERRAKSLLVERILDIGRRLNFGWVAAFAGVRQSDLMSAIDPLNVDVANRINLILKDIGVTVF